MTRRSLSWAMVLVALAASLALNVFMLGYVAYGLRERAVVRSLAAEVAETYPPHVRQEFRAVMRENRPRTLAALRDLRTARAELAAAIKRAPFDAAAVDAAMKKVREATTELQATLQAYLLTALKRVQSAPSG